MANRYFQVHDARNAELDGANKLNTSSTGIYRGVLAGWPSGGSLAISTGSAPYGQFYDFLRLEEKPQSEDLGGYLSGKEVNVVTGKYMISAGPDLFTAGSVAVVGSLLYPGVAGLLDTVQQWPGTAVIGKVVAHHTIADSGGSGSFTAARCMMELPVYNT